MPSQQLTLNVKLREGFRFESFFAQQGSDNAETVATLKAFINSKDAQQNCVWGESLSGKTHLLQACCAKATEVGDAVSYIPLKSFSRHGSEILQGLNQPILILDDIDSVVGDKGWETALFNLINQSRDKQQRLLFSMRNNPRKINCLLPDLASRLIWGGSYQLHTLKDEEKVTVLKTRAEQRGFELNDRVLEYLFRRYPRDLESLMDILNKLDEESLRQKTKITIPFIKQIFE